MTYFRNAMIRDEQRGATAARFGVFAQRVDRVLAKDETRCDVQNRLV